MTTVDRTQRLKELRAEEAKHLGLDINDAAVTRLAILKLQHEIVMSRLVSGETVATSELIELSTAISELSPVPPHKLTVCLVDHSDTCVKCGGPLLCDKCGGPLHPERNEHVLEDERPVRANAPSPLPALPASPSPSPSPSELPSPSPLGRRSPAGSS
jgi:hypothetical protein